MNLKKALEPIEPVVGITSLFGAPESINVTKPVIIGLDDARKKLSEVEEAQEDCGSDAAYWGYQGQISYYKAMIDILEAAELVGEDNLPDVPPPNTKDHVVMDACYYIENYGKTILDKAKEMRQKGQI